MMLELSDKELNLLKKILESHLSELRLEVAATKRGTSSLHEEEDSLVGLIKRLSALK